MKLSNQEFNNLKILHLSLATGMLMFVGIITFLSKPDFTQISIDLDILSIGGIVMALLVLMIAPKLFSSKIEKSEINSDDIRAAYVMKWALFEGVGLINAACLFVTGNILHLVIAVIMLCFLWLAKPSQGI